MGAAALAGSSVARQVFADASAALGWDVERLCTQGPAQQLRDTRYTQVAVHVTNLPVAAALDETGVAPVAVAGHSVGELAALVRAGALSPECGLRLVARRGELMASVPHDGMMLNVVGLADGALGELCERVRPPGGLLGISAENAPRHLVVSGTTAEVRRLADRLAGRRGVRTVPLRVGGAFHSAVYDRVMPRWAAAVDASGIGEPAVPFVSSVVGRRVQTPDSIRHCLVSQLTRRVEWRQAVTALGGLGARCLVEVGEGTAVSRLAQLTCRELSSCSRAWPSHRSASLEASPG
jgi:[acyl-carrier-protein] S-malonyltransferase